MARHGAARDLVFVSYSHLDKEWNDKLLAVLDGYAMQGQLQVWADDAIRLGDAWGEVIDAALARARVAVLVLSTDFVRSKFIMQVELPRLLRAEREHGVCLCCFVVRAVDPGCRALHDPQVPSAPLHRAWPS